MTAVRPVEQQLAAQAAFRFPANRVPSEALNAVLVSYVADIDTDTLREYAVGKLADDIRAIRRAETRRAEEEAERHRREEHRAERDRQAEEQRRRDEEQRRQSEQHGEHRGGNAEPEPDPGPTADELAAQRERKRRERAEAKARRQAQREAADEAARISLDTFLREYRRTLHVEWTADLLSKKFSPRNNPTCEVTWGEATREDHQSRIDMLTHNVRENALTIARHTQALEDLDDAGCSTLNELAMLG